MNYTGIIIEESLKDKNVLKEIHITTTEVEQVTEEHKTPWIKQWTLHTFEVEESKAEDFAKILSKALETEHKWYADYKNAEFHYIVFANHVFKVNRKNHQQYEDAKKYGLSLGIPEYQLDFTPSIM